MIPYGRRLVELRRGESQAEVAKAIGIAVSTLGMYETEQRVPRDTIKISLAKHYETTVQAIFFDEECHEKKDSYKIYREAERIKREVAVMRGESEAKKEDGICLNEVSFSEKAVYDIKGCTVCKVVDAFNDEGDAILFIKLFNPVSKQHIDLEVRSHGLIFISELY